MERLWMTLDQIKAEYASNDYNPELLLQHLLHHVEASPASVPEGLTLNAIHAAWHGAGVDIAGGNWKRFVVMLSAAPTPPVSEDRKDAEIERLNSLVESVRSNNEALHHARDLLRSEVNKQSAALKLAKEALTDWLTTDLDEQQCYEALAAIDALKGE